MFARSRCPDDFIHDSATLLLLRRAREFIANARDLVTLKAAVDRTGARAMRRSRPRSPIVSGDVDKTVTTGIHSRLLAATAPMQS